MQLEELVLPLEVADKAFKAGLAGAMVGIGALVGAMGAAVKTTFDWANELDDIGDKMDATNTQAAAYAFIAHKSGVATETFTKGMVILGKGLVKADGSLDVTGKGLAEWGINVKDVNGKLKSQPALIDAVAKKYGTFATQQEKVNFLTQTFGKSGAELVDFFDVMNKEGGLDGVTKKVQAFGLAIDPARYENFSRNLEEIKLMGTGLAVQFTEKLMPALESITGWVSTFASADPAAKIGMLADPLKELFNLTDAFKQGVAQIDWTGLSQTIAAGINGIDWNLAGQYIRQGISNVLQGINTIVQEVDWQALSDAMGNALAQLVAGLYGYPDWAALQLDFNNGFASLFGYDSSSAFAQLAADFTAGFHLLSDPLVAWGQEIIAWWTQLWVDFGNGSKVLGDTLSGMYNIAAEWVGKIKSLIDSVANFAGGGATPGRMVVGGATNTGGGSQGAAQNQLVTTPGRNVQGGSRRASGGAVIAGQQYNVGEFYRPEKFTPSVNGRVDPMSKTTSQNAPLDITALGTVLARVLAVEMKKGVSN